MRNWEFKPTDIVFPITGLIMLVRYGLGWFLIFLGCILLGYCLTGIALACFDYYRYRRGNR